MSTPKNIRKLMQQIASDDELSRIYEDPVYFSHAVLDITPRWYQAKMLRHPNKKRIARLGRRAGKSWSLILNMLWYAFTKKNTRQLVVAPFGVQVDTIFDEIREIIDETPILEMSVARSVASPQRIEFGNGSIIMGLSAGTSTGRGASSIRGQGADWIYLDECDYLSDDDINSLLGISLEDAGEIGIWAASTPTGARKMFWDWCVNASESHRIKSKEDHTNVIRKRKSGNGWVEFHYPSYVSPNWDQEMEAELRAMFSEQGYIHEVEARFGDETRGVFGKEFIETSKVGYSYEDMRRRDPQPDHIRIIGVDWDKRICPSIKCRELLEYPKAV